MRPALLCVTALAVCVGSSREGWPSAQALPPNPSFEAGRDDRPAQWSFYSWQESDGWWDAEHARIGKRSLGLRGLNGGWSANVPVEGGKVYAIRLYYRAEAGPGRIVLYVRPTERGQRPLLYKPHVCITPDQRGQFVGGDYIGGADEKGWVLFDGGEFRPAPEAKAVNVLVKLVSKNPEARVWLDDVSVTPVAARRVPASAELLRTVADGVVWADSENRKILPDRKPPAGPVRESIQVAAAQGEYESVQVAVTPIRNWEDANWTWHDFSGPASLAKGSLRCRRVETINIDRTMGPHGHKGLNPDPLTDRLPCGIPANTTQSFWFTLRVPHAQSPGAYENRLALIANGNTVCEIPLKLRVRAFAIPRRPSLTVCSSLRAKLVLDVEPGSDDAVLKRYYRSFFEHRTRCPVGVRFRPIPGADPTQFLSHLRFMRDELGAKRFIIPSLWISHRGTHKMPAEVQWGGHRIFANAQLTELDPGFEKSFRSCMAKLVQALQDEGLFLSPTVRFFDEPNFRDPATVKGLRTLASLMLDIEPGLTVSIAATFPHPELTDVIREWILHTDAWYRHLREIEAARVAGCRIDVYNNAVNYPEHRPIRVRLWPWLLRKYGVDGTYSWWGTVCWRGPMANPWTAGQGGSGVLLYPPRSAKERGPISSVRWELFREGLEDYEYLHLADDLAGRLAEAGRPELARRGREAVAAALALVEKWPSVRAANDEPYTLDVTAVAKARENLATAIEVMRQALTQ